ncbi:MAG: ADP-glyceromanno-heptose 6-epimerase [Oligoflexia bacterium]|nr:ADP-glyceromanno-heptose 6-epimerase [Oligoflexia bacterium]
MIILTGAAGFIGSHVYESLANRYRLILVDTPSYFRERNMPGAQESSLWDWAQGKENQETRHKIIDREYFVKVLQQIDKDPAKARDPKKSSVLIPKGETIEAIIHLGACTDTAEKRLDYLNQWNVEYTKSLWSWCVDQQVPFIYASSGATYGNANEGFSDDWETTLRLKPMNPYGQSKQDFDLWVHERYEKSQQCPPNWYGLKFFNVYGPRESHKGPMASAVLHGYRQIMTNGECKLFRSHHPEVKDGEQKRDFIHVSDIVSMVEFVLEKKPASGLYNCGTGKARTFYDLMKAVFQSLGLPEKIQWIDTPEQYRKAYQYFTEAKMQKLLTSGYSKPMVSLEQGVQAYVQWLNEHEPKAKLH